MEPRPRIEVQPGSRLAVVLPSQGYSLPKYHLDGPCLRVRGLGALRASTLAPVPSAGLRAAIETVIIFIASRFSGFFIDSRLLNSHQPPFPFPNQSVHSDASAPPV